MALIIGNVNSKDTMTLADAEFSSRKRMIDIYTNYYNGKHRSHLIGDVDNVVYNLCRQVIDETVAFLLPYMPLFEIDHTQQTETEEYLKALWTANGGVTLLSRMATFGGITGHVFARVMEGGDYPRITAIPSANVIKYVSHDDADVTIGYELRWNEERQTILQDDDGAWIIGEYTRKHNKWELVNEFQWGYSQSPIVDWQHLPAIMSPYGMNEIPHYELNDHINKVASDVKAILRYHAYPTTVGIGFDAKDLQETSINGFLAIPNKDANVFNVEMQSDLASSMNMLSALINRFYAQSRVVILSGLDTFRGMTNLAVRASFMPMTAKTETLRRQYSEGLIGVCNLALEMAGKEAEGAITVEWGEALPVDTREEFNLIREQMEKRLMSPQTASERLGLDFEREQERLALYDEKFGIVAQS